MKPLSVSMALTALLAVLAAPAFAGWDKSENHGHGSTTHSLVPTSTYGTHIASLTVTDDILDLDLIASSRASADPSNDDLTATAKTTSSGWIKDQYDWSGGGTPTPHAFEATWGETFDWHVQGDAEDPDWFSTGTANAQATLNILYSSGPDDMGNCNKVTFGSSSKKVESGSWLPNNLTLTWKPPNPPSLSWNDRADSDCTFDDLPSPTEHADDRNWSAGIYSEASNNVWAKVTVSGSCKAETLSNALLAWADVLAEIGDFELSY